MFEISSETFKLAVQSLAKSARRSHAKDPKVFISTLKDQVSFYFQNTSLSVQRFASANIKKALNISTYLYKLETFVSSLPNEIISVELVINQLELKWGNRNSKFNVPILSEEMAMLEPPTLVETIEWGPGALHEIVSLMSPFCLPLMTDFAKEKPELAGVHFIKEGGKVFLRASNSNCYIRRESKINWFSEIEAQALDASMLQAISEVLPKDSSLTVGRSQSGLITFKSNNVTCVTSPLVATLSSNHINFLDGLFNADLAMSVCIDRLTLIELITRVKKVTSPTKGFLTLVFDDEKITCYSSGDELIQDVSGAYNGSTKAIAIQCAHLELAALAFFENKEGTGELTLSFQDHQSVIVVTFDGEEKTKVCVVSYQDSKVKSMNAELVAKK